MLQLISQLFRKLKELRGPLFVFFVVTLIASVIFFPMNDLGDLVSSQVASATGNQVYVQFDELGLSFFPPGVRLNQVTVETPQIPSVRVDELTVLPSISALLRNQPYGSVSASGFLGGSLNLRLGSGATSEKGVERTQVELEADQLNLKGLRNLLQLPVFFEGQMSLQGQALGDLGLQEPPEAEFSINANRFALTPSTLNLPDGDTFALPELKLKQIEIKGRLNNSYFYLDRAEIGKPDDELYGQLKGQIQVTLRNANGRVLPVFGGYSLEVDLKMQKSFQDKISIFMGLLHSYQKTPGHYRFKVANSSFYGIPSITALR